MSDAFDQGEPFIPNQPSAPIEPVAVPVQKRKTFDQLRDEIAAELIEAFDELAELADPLVLGTDLRMTPREAKRIARGLARYLHDRPALADAWSGWDYIVGIWGAGSYSVRRYLQYLRAQAEQQRDGAGSFTALVDATAFTPTEGTA